MPDVAEQPPQPTDRRGRRVYVWWAVALGLLALLGTFCWAVVVPVWRVRNSVERCYLAQNREQQYEAEIRLLGGPERASKMIVRFYLGGPSGLAPRQMIAAKLLGKCGTTALPLVLQLLHSDDTELRAVAAEALGEIRDERVVHELI